MKPLLFAAAWSLLHVQHAAADEPRLGAGLPQGCTAESAFERLDIVCQVAPDDATGWQLLVDFTGGHDDTFVSIEATLDDQPLDCAAGGKTRSEREFGDIRLTCAIAVQTALLGSARDSLRGSLRFRVRWTHAELAAHALVREK